MKLVASLMVARVEPSRYLEECLAHLLEFCDEIVMLLDGPDWPVATGFASGLPPDAPVMYERYEGSFFEHEGQARQALLDVTLRAAPSHILAIDADEFIADGGAVRAACDEGLGVYQLCMQEIWNAHQGGLEVRQDGGWEEHDVPIVWSPGLLPPAHLTIQDRALACGRVPVAAQARVTGHTGTTILHFGWASKAERKARHARYVEHDGGRYHAGAHLDSILKPDTEVRLADRPWPASWTNRRIENILRNAARDA